MSVVSRFLSPICAPIACEPMTPAAGPEKRAKAGRSLITLVGSTPPAQVIISTGTFMPALRKVSSSRAR